MIKKRKNHKSPFNSAELQSATRGKVLAAGRLQPPFGKGCQYLMLGARLLATARLQVPGSRPRCRKERVMGQSG